MTVYVKHDGREPVITYFLNCNGVHYANKQIIKINK